MWAVWVFIELIFDSRPKKVTYILSLYCISRTQWSQIWRHCIYCVLAEDTISSKNSNNRHVLALRIRVWKIVYSLPFLTKLSNNKGKLFFCKQNAFVNLRVALHWHCIISENFRHAWSRTREKCSYVDTTDYYHVSEMRMSGLQKKRKLQTDVNYNIMENYIRLFLSSSDRYFVRKKVDSNALCCWLIWPERDFISVSCGFAWHVTALMKSMNNKEPIRIQGVLVFTTVPWSAWVNFQLLFHTRLCISHIIEA